MTVAPFAFVDPKLMELRSLRRTQAWTLAAFSAASVALGVAMVASRHAAPAGAFLNAVGWQFVIWGAIDAAFATLGVRQSLHADRRAPGPQAEADEFLAAEKLMASLRLNHKLNVAYLVTAGLLLAWAGGAHNAGLAGHGAGVLVQGGFLFLFDLHFTHRLGRLMAAPV